MASVGTVDTGRMVITPASGDTDTHTRVSLTRGGQFVSADLPRHALIAALRDAHVIGGVDVDVTRAQVGALTERLLATEAALQAALTDLAEARAQAYEARSAFEAIAERTGAAV